MQNLCVYTICFCKARSCAVFVSLGENRKKLKGKRTTGKLECKYIKLWIERKDTSYKCVWRRNTLREAMESDFFILIFSDLNHFENVHWSQYLLALHFLQLIEFTNMGMILSSILTKFASKLHMFCNILTTKLWSNVDQMMKSDNRKSYVSR